MLNEIFNEKVLLIVLFLAVVFLIGTKVANRELDRQKELDRQEELDRKYEEYKSTRENNIRYGWYSALADEQFGHALYFTPDGNKVKITVIGSDKTLDKSLYKFPDTKYVGEVTDIARLNWKKND